MGDPQQFWQVPPQIRLLWRSYEDHFMVHNCASGQTHYLNLLAAIALQQMEERPATIEDIRRRVHAEAEGEEIVGLDQLPGLVAQLDELGLIAPYVP
jgi:PqqD family protein of HPr-rel-A system